MFNISCYLAACVMTLKQRDGRGLAATSFDTNKQEFGSFESAST